MTDLERALRNWVTDWDGKPMAREAARGILLGFGRSVILWVILWIILVLVLCGVL